MFTACHVITITTDFGHQGPFVATMKGMILSRFPEARIIDVTHEVLVYLHAEAGVWLSRAYLYLPYGSVYVAVVSPGVVTKREIICVLSNGHAFLAPDNGLLAPVVNRVSDVRSHRLEVSASAKRLQLA